MQPKQLKPLTHKKLSNGNSQQLIKPSINKIGNQKTDLKAKTIVISNQQNSKTKKQAKTEQSQTKSIKYQRSSRPSTAIQLYDCDDFDMPGLEEEDAYFQSQLVKNIKTESFNKTQKPVPKSQVVLPKLEGDMKVKQLKDLQKQMDLQMSRIYDAEEQS